jgi:hypothetical protein
VLHDPVTVHHDFAHDGMVHVREAFDPRPAAALCDRVWDDLRRRYGIDRTDRATWRVEAPDHLQHLKGAPEMATIGSEALCGAIDSVLDGAAWQVPRHWGAFFVLFPTPGAARDVPTGTWHIDAPYGRPVHPIPGVKVFTLLADVAPCGGGTMLVAGSHRAGARWGRGQSASVLAKNARARRAWLRSDPWFEALCAPGGDPAARVERFMNRDTAVEGVPLRVVEITGDAGDAWLVHPGVLHCRPVNCSSAPRFVLAKDLHCGVERQVRATAAPAPR